LRSVAFSVDRGLLAGAGENLGQNIRIKVVELIDLATVRAGRGEALTRLPIPQPRSGFRYPHALAFDRDGTHLAIGAREVPDQIKGKEFFKETGGKVYVFDLANLAAPRRLSAVLDVGYRPDALAFRPWTKQLATAGGNNHEVRLWDLEGRGTLLDAIESPGSCLWGVALSKPDGAKKVRYLAWKDWRNPNPRNPNDWGDPDPKTWRVFDLGKRSILPHPPKDFEPVLPRASIQPEGADEPWQVRTTHNSYLWHVVGPGGTDVALDATSGLYKPHFNNMPRCYTFLPHPRSKTAVRLAVGHTWGVSLYDCAPGKVRLARVMIGHDGEVMAVAPSADSKLLVTASRDQTLAGWSLEDWPTQRELGATFQKSRGGQLEVKEVSAGSPAWEAIDPLTGGEHENCRLAEGDEIEMVLITVSQTQKYLYDPRGQFEKLGRKYDVRAVKPNHLTLAGVLDMLRDVGPNQEYLFYKKVNGKDVFKLTTVRQRPLWRFFPERRAEPGVLRRGGQFEPQGKDWVVWRYRDFYFDTNSPRADAYVGWQVNRGVDERPDFFPLERFRGSDEVKPRGGQSGLQQPDRIWRFFDQAFQQPDQVIFPDIQPPDVKLEVITKPDKANDLVLRITIRPRDAGDKQKLGRVINLWLNDYKYPVALKPDVRGVVEVARLVIKRSELRHGHNVLTLQAYNVEGGRGQDSRTVDFDDGTRPVRTLRALCVGISDYTQIKGYDVGSLKCPRNDADEMSRVLLQHADSRLYSRVIVRSLLDDKATAAEIIKQLHELGREARPDDWLVLFLSGHGHALSKEGAYQPGSFFYVCTNTQRGKPETHLTSRRLYDALAEVRCSKLLIVDCCHSGDVASNPLRDLSREGVPFLILSACKNDQAALEPKKGGHGLFTQSLLETIADSTTARGKRRARELRANAIGASIRRRLPDLLARYKEEADVQTPEFLPRDLTGDAVLCKP
jgi:hypothetical protein